MWKKVGRIFVEDVKIQTPVPLILDDKKCRVFYSRRNKDNKSEINFFDFNLDLLKVEGYSNNSVLIPGSLGAFDNSGVMPSSVIVKDDAVYMYYTGWSRRTDVPYHNAIGLAISYDFGLSFEKYCDGPLIGSSIFNPYFVGTPFVIKEEDDWVCWYYSCVGWFSKDGCTEPRYNIKNATSKDGILWNLNKDVSIDFSSDYEGGLCSPSIIKEDGIYKMWYSKRNTFNYRESLKDSYRIGYAESKDKFLWHRKDKYSGIDVSNSGWDSKMICYSSVIKYKNKKYMFYCGNDFGTTGIGLAIR
jgi:hypothetical protein